MTLRLRLIFGGGISLGGLCGAYAGAGDSSLSGPLVESQEKECGEDRIATLFTPSYVCCQSCQSVESSTINSRALAEYRQWLQKRGTDTTNVELKVNQDGEGYSGIYAVLSDVGKTYVSSRWFGASKVIDMFKKDPVVLSFPVMHALSYDSIAESNPGHLIDGLERDSEYHIIMHIMIEKMKGQKSYLNEWLQMLPRHFSQPVCWSQEELEWLRGTSLYSGSKFLRKELERSWERLKPLCGEIAKTDGIDSVPTFEDFLWASAAFKAMAVPLPQRRVDDGDSFGLHIVPGTDMLPWSSRGNCRWDICNDGKSLCAICSRKMMYGKQVSRLTASAAEDMSMEQLIFQYGILDIDPEREVLMINCPIPAPNLWDITMKKRFARLLENDLRPQLFLTQSHYKSISACQFSIKKSMTSSQRQEMFKILLPGDVLKTLEIFVMDVDELDSRSIGSSVISKEDEIGTDVQSSGMRMAVMTTIVRLLEMKLEDLESIEEGTGSLESDQKLEEVFKEHIQNVDGSAPTTHQMAALGHRMAQKALTRDYLRVYNDYLQDEMRYLHRLQKESDV